MDVKKMFLFRTSLLILNFFGVVFSHQSFTFIQTRLGGIRGLNRESFSGRKFEAYEGIPYALPPVGERRFEPPKPIEQWMGTVSATKAPNSCIQYSHTPGNFMYDVLGDEDCLYLNVYVPANRDKPLPVLFIIHGGAFQFGRGSTGSGFLMDKDVIMVSVNYRLGMFGFLSTEDENVLGNMGLKDQSLALRWVAENIENFGGDPKRITLLGISAGGASVHYHYLSPMSKGLFQNGISLSGGVFGPGKQTENAREKAFKLGALMGCPTQEAREMIDCLRYRPPRAMAQATQNFMPWLYNPFTPFGPVVEKSGDKPFIDRSPIEIISSGDAADVLWIHSLTSEEGLYPVAEYINNDEYLEDLNKNWEKIAPHLLDYNFTISLEKHAEVARKIRYHYFGNKPIDRSTIKQLTYMVGDRLYAVDGEKAARWQAKMNKNPVLFWYYSYRALTSVSDSYSQSMNNYGVSHSDNIYMILENPCIYPPMSKNDRTMQKKLIDFVVSIAEKGYPDMNLDFEWKKVDPTKEELDFLHIAGPDNIYMDSNDNVGQKRFWATIDFNENKLPTS